MADPNRDPDAVRRDRTNPIPGRRMSENESDLDSGPDTEVEDEEDTDAQEDEQKDR